jgi:beta-galactosidase/beta-glucuronidase
MVTLPKPEYPRPQFVRNSWLNLNGEWEFAFDDEDRGALEGWHDGRILPLRITVPFPYQSEASGINDKSIHEVVWYARTLEWEDGWKDHDVLLHFGAVDYFTTVWVNGQEVGHNRGGHVPFSFDIAPYLKKGVNRITLRVVDRNDPYQPRGKQSTTGLPHEIDYWCTTGIWQTAWIEPVPPIRIDSLRITPVCVASGVELRVYLHAPSTGWTLEADICDGEEVIVTSQRHVSMAFGRFFLHMENPIWWTPEHPHLYDLRVRLFKDGELVDDVSSYFGMRSVEIRDGRFFLNGEACYLKMVLDQGYWPEGLLAAPSDEALRADVEWAKKFGYNGARKHQKIEDPRWLYWCDKLGLMVWGEMANARAWSAGTEEALMAEWQRALNRDFNHPCIVTWVPVNESMGFPGLREGHPGQYAFLERIVMATRLLDPERPVIDNDGWEHTDVTDICAIHDYTPTAEGLLKRYQATLKGKGLPTLTWVPDKPVFTHGSKDRGQPIMLTEVGGFLTRPYWLPQEEWDVLYRHYGTVGTAEELLEKYRDLMRGLAQLPFVSGFCYTQLTDVEQEMNGLLTYDRKPKLDADEIAKAHASMFAGDRSAVPV